MELFPVTTAKRTTTGILCAMAIAAACYGCDSDSQKFPPRQIP